MPNSTRLWKLLKIAEFRRPTHQDVRKKGSKILKLPSVRNCLTLTMTNKLIVIINSLKVSKIKTILLYEMKFLAPNYSCLQKPWLEGYRRQIPFCLSSVLNCICWTSPEKIPGYATGLKQCAHQDTYQILHVQLASGQLLSTDKQKCKQASRGRLRTILLYGNTPNILVAMYYVYFRRVRKIAKSDHQLRHICLSVCPSMCLSFRMEKLGPRRTHFNEMWYWCIFR